MYEYFESRNYIDTYRLLFCDREILVSKIEYFLYKGGLSTCKDDRII